jgi:hypothetical protein
MGSTSFGANDRSLVRRTASQDMEGGRGSNGCATASDHT